MISNKQVSTLKYKKWQCGTCESVLGMIYPTGILAIKHKEFYCWIAGKCRVVCRKCGAMNNHTTDSTLEDIDDLIN